MIIKYTVDFQEFLYELSVYPYDILVLALTTEAEKICELLRIIRKMASKPIVVCMELLQILLSTDKKTLQMIVLKMMGYAPKEISHHMELPEQTVYTRLRRLREKIKKAMKFE